MSPSEKSSGPRPPPGDEASPPGRKRVWQPPRVRTGHLFESNSLACGKNTPSLEQCVQNPVSS
ncbi:MAG TPA: hypothetical protein VGP07_07645 [Polyangia bacterium]